MKIFILVLLLAFSAFAETNSPPTPPAIPAVAPAVQWTGHLVNVTNNRVIVEALIVDGQTHTNRVFTNETVHQIELGTRPDGTVIWRRKN